MKSGLLKSKEEGKDQETTYLIATADPGHHMEK